MNAIHYIGLDVHKKTISYCIKTAAGQIVEEGTLAAERSVLRSWAGSLEQPWHGAMEATTFSASTDLRHTQAVCGTLGDGPSGEDEGDYERKEEERYYRCPYDCRSGALRPAARLLCVPAGAAGSAPSYAYRQMMVQQSVRMHNKTAGLLMESGVSFRKTKLQGKKYFADLIKSLEEVPESVKDLLLMSRAAKELFEGVQNQLVRRLLADAVLKQRVERLSSIDGVGAITALSWALEVGDPHRFASIADAVSYCGFPTAALRSSAGKQQRGPLSKQRNAYLQTTLIEAAKLAPRWNSQLAQLYAQQLQRGHANRATLQVARRLVAYCSRSTRTASRFRCGLRLRSQKQSRERAESQQFWNQRPKGKDMAGSGLLEFSQACRSIVSVRANPRLTSADASRPKRQG